jgi:hypothetical protein
MIPTQMESVSREASPSAKTGAVSAIAPEPEKPTTPAASPVSAGMPFEALEHIFLFTTGEGSELMQSADMTEMLREIIGADWNSIREKASRDVFSRCDIAERLRSEGKVPSSAWNAMSAIKPALIQQARAGAFHTCVRTFSIETGAVVAVFLFYDKQKVGD